MKRLFDIFFACLALIIMSPAFLLVALMIKREDDGPALYRGQRVGRFGRPFFMYKFRTMVVDAEKRGGSNTADSDPRITKVGRWLRKTKLDEIPQLINVLKGDMSIVGPRPEVAMYVNMFNEQEKAILTVRPGITDWASLWDHDEGATLANYADPDKAYLEVIRPQKIKRQLRYVAEHNFLTDIKIIWLTFLTFFRRK